MTQIAVFDMSTNQHVMVEKRLEKPQQPQPRTRGEIQDPDFGLVRIAHESPATANKFKGIKTLVGLVARAIQEGASPGQHRHNLTYYGEDRYVVLSLSFESEAKCDDFIRSIES